ncbi:hypothetical protein Ancab_033944 [Ancistrocladus abbreviatus]
MDSGDLNISWIERLSQEWVNMWSQFEDTVEQNISDGFDRFRLFYPELMQDLDSLSSLSSTVEPSSTLLSAQQQIPEVFENQSLEMASGEAVDKCNEILADSEFSETEYFEPILIPDNMDENAEKQTYAFKGGAGSYNALMQCNDNSHVMDDEDDLDALYGSFIIVDKEEFHGIPCTPTKRRFLKKKLGQIASLLMKRVNKKREGDQQTTPCQIHNQTKQDEGKSSSKNDSSVDEDFCKSEWEVLG